MEYLILHIIKYLFVAAVLKLGGFKNGQSVAMTVVLSLIDLSFKIWMGRQFVAIYDAIKGKSGE